ncbi:hypothetical protein ABZ407_38580 [Streptomyces tibetensis]
MLFGAPLERVRFRRSGCYTLLKLIVGEPKPGSGSLAVDGTLGHLPQALPLTGDPSVAEVLSIAAVIRALRLADGTLTETGSFGTRRG